MSELLGIAKTLLSLSSTITRQIGDIQYAISDHYVQTWCGILPRLPEVCFRRFQR